LRRQGPTGGAADADTGHSIDLKAQSLLYFHDRLDLDGIVARKRLHPHRTAGVYACLPKYLDHEIGKPVDDRWALSKSLNGIDVTDHFHHALHTVQAAQNIPSRRKYQ